MANQLVPAASTYISGLSAPLGLQATMISGLTSIAGASSFTFVPAVMVNNVYTPVILWATIGVAGAGNFVFAGAGGNPGLTIAVANSASYFFGPFDPAVYASAGLVTCTPTVFTGNSVGAFLLPMPYVPSLGASGLVAGYRSLHNPLEMTVGAADF